MPSSVDWIASVTRYVPSSSGHAVEVERHLAVAVGDRYGDAERSCVLVPKMVLPSSSWIAMPNEQVVGGLVGVVRDADRHRLVGQQPRAPDERAGMLDRDVA